MMPDEVSMADGYGEQIRKVSRLGEQVEGGGSLLIFMGQTLRFSVASVELRCSAWILGSGEQGVEVT